MTGEGEQREPSEQAPRPARRSSPRLSIRRLVLISSPRWKKYREVYSKNIGRRSLMVVVPDDPPAAREPIAVWMGVDNHERPRRWTKGHVVRLQPDVGAEGEVGVVIQLSDPKAEAIWCLVARGNEDEVYRPRAIPRFQKAPDKGPDRRTVNERLGASVPVALKPAIELDKRSPEAHGEDDSDPPEGTGAQAESPPYESISVEAGAGVIEERISPVDGSPLGDLDDEEDDEAVDDERDDDDDEDDGDVPEEVTQVDAKLPEGVRPSVPPIAAAHDDLEVIEKAVASLGAGTPEPDEAAVAEAQLDAIPTMKLSPVPVQAPVERPETRRERPKAKPPAPPPVPADARKPQRPAAELPRPPARPGETPKPPPPSPRGDPFKPPSPPGARIPAAPAPGAAQGEVPRPPPPEPFRPPIPAHGRAQTPPTIPAATPGETPRPPSPAPRAEAPSVPPPGAEVRHIGAIASGERQAAPAIVTGKAPVIGIDFGTTYSKVALLDRGDVILVEDPRSTSSTRTSVPSVVAYQPDGSVLVGEPAQELLAVDPSVVISSVKRAMGLKYSDPLANGILGSLGCQTSAGPNDTIQFDMHGASVTVPEAASKILTYLREMASEFVGADVKQAVMTMPVDFGQAAKRELELAARAAGIEIRALVPEPVAAAMGCGYDGRGTAVVAVYDLGGGTFDASVVEVGKDRFLVRGAAGDRWLGGDDFDELVARYVADQFQKQTGISLHNRVVEWRRLLFACEEAKRWLSTLNGVDVVLPRAALSAEGAKTLLVPLTRTAFDEATKELVMSTVEICKQAARQARISPKEVDALLVTGGSTRIPSVRHAAQRLFDKPPAMGIHPQHAVVIGAAVRAAVLSRANVPDDFAERLRGHGTVGRTIGLALAGGTTEHIIDAAERPPFVAHRQYSTHRDDQTTIRIELVQGNSARTAENQPVGGFIIEGLPKKKAGVISLDVYFELSSTGTLYVTAQERSTGQRAQGIFDLDGI
jgi:molecular chaperone DnaK